jgi:hypothetical protein
VAGVDSRLVAYLGNWQSCPNAAQVAKYTHIVVAFAVTYTWKSDKNVCDQSCTIGTPVPICNNAVQPSLMAAWKAAGKKVIVSFGGAGMGGSWLGDVNNCWDYCFGKETSVVNQLTAIVKNQVFDGVDIDYEYFYSTQQQQNFISSVTTGLRAALPVESIVAHAPMDSDLVSGKAYYEILRGIASSLSFIMPQYYNGITRPVLDGIGGTGVGSVSALSHYTNLLNNVFNGDTTKVVFGFCISDCSGTNSNANAVAAVKVMSDLKSVYPCNGGAMFWVAENDSSGSWSVPVSEVSQPSSGCSVPSIPVTMPVATPFKPILVPVTTPVVKPAVTPVSTPAVKPLPVVSPSTPIFVPVVIPVTTPVIKPAVTPVSAPAVKPLPVALPSKPILVPVTMPVNTPFIKPLVAPVSTTVTPLSQPVASANCAPVYKQGITYVAGDQVSNVGSNYRCKPWPYSGWCPQASYAPGTSIYWNDAWDYIGLCS